jgi:ubiquinone/menaquinone biosynthesis C-methylase UbiE
MRYFPHQLSFLIDNPLRALLISPVALAGRLQLRPGARVLEIGPGSGFFSLELARRVPAGRLELFDLQAEMLVKARAKLRRAGLRNAGFTQGDAGSLPFASAAFDAALLVAVLGEVPDRRACLQSLRRVLRPGGLLAFHEQLPDPDRIAPESLRAGVEREGFRFREQFGPRWNYTALFDVL